MQGLKQKTPQSVVFQIVAVFFAIRALGGVRTPNHRSRNPIFYPVELRVHSAKVEIVTLQKYFSSVKTTKVKNHVN